MGEAVSRMDVFSTPPPALPGPVWGGRVAANGRRACTSDTVLWGLRRPGKVTGALCQTAGPEASLPGSDPISK